MVYSQPDLPLVLPDRLGVRMGEEGRGPFGELQVRFGELLGSGA